jgi:tetratricopeptide (TPR) repeat protein
MNSNFYKSEQIFLSQKMMFALAVIFFLLTLFFNRPEEQKRSEYLPPPVAVKYLSVGLSYQLADSLWLRALQDFDYCEIKTNEKECKAKSWLFQTLNLATEIDPKLQPTMYSSAGLALTVIISDYVGASIIFDKAVRQYPKNWNIAYTAAYHALYEEKNKAKAARLYEKAAQNGAPSWIYSLAGRVALDNGDEAYSRQILEGMIVTNQDEKIIKRLKDKIAEIEAARKSQKK